MVTVRNLRIAGSRCAGFCEIDGDFHFVKLILNFKLVHFFLRVQVFSENENLQICDMQLRLFQVCYLTVFFMEECLKKIFR